MRSRFWHSDMTAKIKWTQTRIERLGESNECIYNIRSPIYLGRNATFTKICQELDIPYVNAFEVKKKWRDLRTQYLRGSRIAQFQKSGSGVSDIFSPKLWCFSLQQFLLSHTQITLI